jgi:hypothetical protein
MDVTISPDGQTVHWGPCSGCGGDGELMSRKNGEGTRIALVLEDLISEWEDHMRRSHNMQPPCREQIEVNGRTFFCTISTEDEGRNHTHHRFDVYTKSD